MKKSYKAIFIFVLSLLIAKTSYADPLPENHKIMLIGDSLAVGLAPRFKALAKDYEYIPISHTKGGTTITQWSYWLQQKIDMHHPDLLLVSLGTNDSASCQNSPLNNPEKLDKLINIAKKEGITLVWIGIPTMPQKRIPCADEMSNLIKDKVEFYFESREYEFKRSSDKIHFTSQGYQDWMDEIWTWMAFNSLVDGIYDDEY